MRCEKSWHIVPESAELKPRTDFYTCKKRMLFRRVSGSVARCAANLAQQSGSRSYCKDACVSVTVWLIVHRQRDIWSVCCLQSPIECASGAYHVETGFPRHFVSVPSRANLQKQKIIVARTGAAPYISRTSRLNAILRVWNKLSISYKLEDDIMIVATQLDIVYIPRFYGHSVSDTDTITRLPTTAYRDILTQKPYTALSPTDLSLSRIADSRAF